MREKAIEEAAAHSKPIPDHPTAVELCLYTSLRALYNDWHKGNIHTEKAKAEKSRILSQCRRYDEEYAAMTVAYALYQSNIRKSGTLLSDIEKSDDILIIAMKACECVGLLTGDDEFLKRQMNKFKEKKYDRI